MTRKEKTAPQLLREAWYRAEVKLWRAINPGKPLPPRLRKKPR